MTESIHGLLAKVRRDLGAAERLLDAGDTDIPASRTYYAKHSAVIAAYGKAFARTEKLDPAYHRAIIDAFGVRSDADYALDPQFVTEGRLVAIATARRFVDEAEAYLGPLAAPPDA
jgi:uncharacterized protein (UPF0332 family)